MNYHPTNDYPINLEHVFKMIGFANKENAKRTLKNNFTEGEDYKKLLVRMDEQVPNLKDGKNIGGAGLNQETVMLNVDTFKNLCMLAKTDKGKELRKYYVKLENIYNQIIKEELQEKESLLQESSKKYQIELQEKDNNIESQKLLIKKKDKELKQMAKKISLDWLYVAVTDNVECMSKIGIAEEILKRVDGHLSSNPGFKYVFTYQSKNNKLIEKCIKSVLDPFLSNKSEWFNIDSSDLIYIVKFFIELFDKNNGSEDPKLIVEFIKNISKKEIEQEYISNELYDKFFEEEIEIDRIGNKKYKCTLISIQKEFEKWLKSKCINIDKPLKTSNESVKYLDIYKLDVKRYIKNIHNKIAERIHIDDVRNDIHISSVIGYSGFRMKNLYAERYFNEDIYLSFMNEYLIVDNVSRIALSEILSIFDKYLEIKNIDSKFVKAKKYFTMTFREEFAREIIKYSNIELIRKLNTGKRNGYAGFIGIKMRK
jgi:phage anti-repressor protein